jgi:hypothetical protein
VVVQRQLGGQAQLSHQGDCVTKNEDQHHHWVEVQTHSYTNKDIKTVRSNMMRIKRFSWSGEYQGNFVTEIDDQNHHWMKLKHIPGKHLLLLSKSQFKVRDLRIRSI